MSLHQPSRRPEHPQSSDEHRQDRFAQVFRKQTTPSLRVIRQAEPGLISVVASYDDKKSPTDPMARQNTLAKTIEVMAAQLRYLPQEVRKNFHLVLADNGMSSGQLSAAQNVIDSVNAQLRLAGTGQIHFHIARAHKDPSNPLTATAAYARNKAFSLIRNMRRDDPRFSAPMFVTDDDAVLRGLANLHAALTRSNGEYGAVAPLNRTTTDVIETANTLLPNLWGGKDPTSSSPATRLFPGITDTGGAINFCLLTAFGGTRVPKTCALMLDGNAVHSMQNDDGELFIVCPEGSFEDMALSAGLERKGYKVAECAEAEVFDQVRVDPRARGLQQFRWAFDHGKAFHDFICIGETTGEKLVFDGLSVLEPGAGRWLLSRIPGTDPRVSRPLNTESVVASIVNPYEVKELLSRIEISLAVDPDNFVAKHPYAFEGRDGSFRDIDVLKKTVRLCRTLINQTLPSINVDGRETLDVPVMLVSELPPADQLRFDTDSRTARLLGNLAAIASMTANDIEQGVLRIALLGPRQPTR